MKEFYAINDMTGMPCHIVKDFASFYVMNEGEEITLVDKISHFTYLGEYGDRLLHKTIMDCLCIILEKAKHDALEGALHQFVERMKRFDLRVDNEDEIAELTFKLTEYERDEWCIEISDRMLNKYYGEDGGYSEEEAKGVGRRIIEAAIALGIDIRVTWEFHRIDNETKAE